MESSEDENLALIEGQQWKLWLSGILLAIAGGGFLLPDTIASVFGVAGVAVELGALLLAVVGLVWAIYAVRCRNCGLRLVIYAMSRQGIGQWLQWLLAVKQCPKCGADHAGRLP